MNSIDFSVVNLVRSRGALILILYSIQSIDAFRPGRDRRELAMDGEDGDRRGNGAALILVLAHEIPLYPAHAEALVEEAADACNAACNAGSLSTIVLVVVGCKKVVGRGKERLDGHARDWTSASQHHNVLWSNGELIFGRIVKRIGLENFQRAGSPEGVALQASLLNLLQPSAREIASGVRSVLTRMRCPPIGKATTVTPLLDDGHLQAVGLDGRLHAADRRTISVVLPALQAAWRDFETLRDATLTTQSPPVPNMEGQALSVGGETVTAVAPA